MQVLAGNILDITYGYIVHQCNCRTKNSRGLATQIFQKYPYANIYRYQNNLRVPGNIQITHNVIGLFAQDTPGKPNSTETKELRLQWFIECLTKLQKVNFYSLNYKSNILNFPYGIGCGLGGGNWESYLIVLEQFHVANPHLIIRIIKLPDK